MSFIRKVAVAAGYTVYPRSSHGLRQAYDWSPKHPMLSMHFDSEQAAWNDVDRYVADRLEEADRLVAIAKEVAGQE